MRLQHYLHLAIMATPFLCTGTLINVRPTSPSFHLNHTELTQSQFDTINAAPLTVTTPITIENSMKFNYFNALNGGSTVAGGVQPTSGDIIAATAFQIRFLARTFEPANFTVQYSGSPYKSFDLQAMDVACALATTATTAFVPTKCRVRLTPFDANNNALTSRELDFSPDSSGLQEKSKMTHYSFGVEALQFRGIVAVRVELLSNNPIEQLLTGIGFDSIKVKYYS
jgi:hypothetical protein